VPAVRQNGFTEYAAFLRAVVQIRPTVSGIQGREERMTVLLIVLVAVLLLLCFKMFVGDEKYLQARKFEREKKFREACYFYGVALYNGTGESSESKKRIRELWQYYGPFDYADIDPEACKANFQGHVETLKIIMEVVTGK
jgi:hypothetical protein